MNKVSTHKFLGAKFAVFVYFALTTDGSSSAWYFRSGQGALPMLGRGVFCSGLPEAKASV